MKLTIKRSKEITGGIGFTTKTGFSYGLPARTACNVGSKLSGQKGSACFGCYARGGNYAYPSVKQAHANRLTSVQKLNDSEASSLWVQAMVTLILNVAKKHSRNMWFFRWHDSGDLVSVDHLRTIAEVARNTPEISHWLPTKEVNVVRDFLKTDSIPDNLTIRLSAYFIDKPADFNLDLPTAMVYKEKEATGHECPAVQNHKGCLGNNCRLCWDSDIKTVCYKYHR